MSADARQILREHWRHADVLLRRLPRNITPESVHAARVAIRRLRTVLAAIAPAVAPRLLARLREDLKDIARELGRVRDADVRCERIPDATGPLMSALRADRRNARRHLRNQLRSPAATARREGISRIIDAERLFTGKDDADALLADAVRRRCRKLARSLKKDCDSPARCHALRIRVKKCRYLLDACRVRPRRGRARQVIAQLHDLQDRLGDLNDLEQTRRWLADQDAPSSVTRAQRAALRAGASRSASRLARLRRKLRPRDVASLYP